MCCNQEGDIFTLEGTTMKLVDKFTYLVCSDSSTEKDIDTKAWTAIDKLSIIWKSDLTDKMKRSFFQAAVVLILLYGCTTWTLTKRLEKKLDGNYTRVLRAILNKSWRSHPTRHQLYGHLPPITKAIQVRRTRHAGHSWRSRDELISDVLLWTPHMAEHDDQLEPTYRSCGIRDVTLKTCQRRWTIGRSGERGSRISVEVAWHDDDDLLTRRLIGLVGSLFANGPGDLSSIPVASYQRLLKWYLTPPCLAFSNRRYVSRYVSRVKWSNPGKGVEPSPTHWCCSYWKGSLLVALDNGHQLYFFTYLLTEVVQSKNIIGLVLWVLRPKLI